MSTHRSRKRIREAKRKARPELSTGDLWVQKDFANTFNLDYKVDDTLERISVGDVSPEEFIDRQDADDDDLVIPICYRYEAPYKPVVIQGVQDNWGARQEPWVRGSRLLIFYAGFVGQGQVDSGETC